MDDAIPVVVKFVINYGAEAHQAMAEEGYGPRLLYHGFVDVTSNLPSYGKLRMVVMEYVHGKTLAAAQNGVGSEGHA